MRRKFNATEKEEIKKAANGKCCSCGKELGNGWHADHVFPAVQGGNTVVANGQALCKLCNLKKGFQVLDQ